MVAKERKKAISEADVIDRGGDDDGEPRNSRMPQYLKLDQAASELATNLGVNCRERRANMRISQAELSERTGIAASHLSYIEHGRANPTLEVLQSLADGLGCTVLDLLAKPGASKVG